MQNAAFSALGLDLVYVAWRLPRGAIKSCTEAMRAMGIRGLNITVPHKIDVLPCLDAIDPAAARIGAVNTIVNEDGRLTGYNTDAAGFIQGIDAADTPVKDMDVVVLGAGGAARAVVFSLLEQGARVTVLNRDVSRAESLARDASTAFGMPVLFGTLSDASLEDYVPRASLLVNTTVVGMHPLADVSPCPQRLLRAGLAVCDIVYNPRLTVLLRDAAERGATTIEGVEMLVRQGAAAFELWTGRPAPVQVMRSVVLEELQRAAH
jgi:shikimate dehydrogenase